MLTVVETPTFSRLAGDYLASGEIWLLLIDAKNVHDNIPGHVLRQIKQEIEDA